ncbi:MAG: shikimate dehydrogenase [Christensenellaceae bacterium]|jgi:shikimate dehydrogenase|nr:shikimate dehydrogenase [Christensenellaceae bacterium]
MKLGLIGKKLPYSYSKVIHNAFGYDYEIKELQEDGFDSFMQDLPFDAFNITIPYKEKVIPYINVLSDAARVVNAVNTVVKKEGKLYGYNTDIFGLTAALKRSKIPIKGEKVLIFGGGGASKAAQFVCKTEGAEEIIVMTRTGTPNFNDLANYKNSTVIINATPVGTYPDNGKRLVDIGNFNSLKGVFDMIYNPAITDLLFQAKAKGAAYANGLFMLISQASYAKDLFFNTPHDGNCENKVYADLAFKATNIVLIGMPSTGKSTVGRHLSRILDVNFIDTDNEIEKKEGKSIPEIFEQRGEAYFRGLERSVVDEVSKERGQVIATGGGAPLFFDNYFKLKQNGILIHLTRPPETVTRRGRPLLTDTEAFNRLYAERMPKYAAIADFTISNTTPPFVTAKRITDLLNK